MRMFISDNYLNEDNLFLFISPFERRYMFGIYHKFTFILNFESYSVREFIDFYRKQYWDH